MAGMNYRATAALLALLAAPAAAADCRSLLQPLLLDPAPDPARLAAVLEYCDEAAAAGDADALYQSALPLLGLNGRWEPATASTLIAEAAARGVAEAQYWMAWQRETGPLLADDPAEALYWYQLAADNEHRLALERLGDAFEHGELGLAADADEAALMRARAAACLDP